MIESMAKNLVIVESPNKIAKIESILGPDYKVLASVGHIRDLRKKNFSIDTDKKGDFEPVYEIPEDKKNVVADLKRAVKQADTVWLATDEDREGEAIAWHLSEVLGLDPKTTRRVVFHTITPEDVLEGMKHPREIDIDLVNAQQARRVLDRIVGFELSPVLWKKIKPALSAGRVQSAVARLVMDREKEIRNFKPEQYYRINADFMTPGGKPVRAELSRRLADDAEAREFLTACEGARFTVDSVNVRPVRKAPAPPFTTSTLQQEASSKLGISVSQVMRIAQSLYEEGHITYMRTDSVNLSASAMEALRKEINENIGAQYYKERHYHTTSKGAQEAHEAIRPSYISKSEIQGTPQERRLYSLIWKRTVASQMTDAEFERTTVDIAIDRRPEHFRAAGQVLRFDGFLKVYIGGTDDDDEQDDVKGLLPEMRKGDALTAEEITATQRYTEAPARYNEKALVKKMEELGIGRPSTYATMVSTVQQRDYVEKGSREGTPRDFEILTLKPGKPIAVTTRTETVGSEEGKLVPTDIGMVVNDFLTEYFPNILDYNFTAQVEEKFDDIASGKLPWHKEIQEFYTDFHPEVENASDIRLEHKVGERVLGTDPKSGHTVSVKIGRFGPMVQLGDGDGEEKPQFASLLKGQSINDITLEQALKLFEFPRHIGEFEGKDVTVAIGRFGPYIRHDNKFISIPKDISPAQITLDEAEELIKAKRQAEANRVVRVFEDDDIQILNGRYGVYIASKGNNYKIPKSVADPRALTLEECKAIIADQDAKPRKTRSPRSKK